MNTKTIETGTDLALAPSRDLVSNFPTGEEISALVALTRAEALAAAAEFDVTTVTGRNSIISVAVTVRDKKVKLGKAADKSKIGHQDAIKEINKGAKTVKDEFQEVQDEIRKPVTDWEDAEESRVDDLKIRLVQIHVNGFTSDNSSEELQHQITAIEQIKIDDSWQEFLEEAAKLKDATLESLRNFLDLSTRREAMEWELAKRRAADAARERLDAYEALQVQAEVDNKAFDQAIKDAEIAAAEAAEAERRRIEQAAAAATKAAEEKAEAERIEAERKHQQELADARAATQKSVDDKVKADAAERKKAADEQERRDANKKLRNAASTAIASHIKGMNRNEVVAAIMANEIPHVKLIL